MIEIRSLHKSFGALKVLQGVDLQIPKGKTTVILGRSGVGKSVLLKHIIGLIKPDRGKIWIDGVDITQLGDTALNELRKKFGMLFQDAALFDSLNVGANVAFPLREHTKLIEKDMYVFFGRILNHIDFLENDLPFPFHVFRVKGGIEENIG